MSGFRGHSDFDLHDLLRHRCMVMDWESIYRPFGYSSCQGQPNSAAARQRSKPTSAYPLAPLISPLSLSVKGDGGAAFLSLTSAPIWRAGDLETLGPTEELNMLWSFQTT